MIQAGNDPSGLGDSWRNVHHSPLETVHHGRNRRDRRKRYKQRDCDTLRNKVTKNEKKIETGELVCFCCAVASNPAAPPPMKIDTLIPLGFVAAAASIIAAILSILPTNDRAEFGKDTDGIHRFRSSH